MKRKSVFSKLMVLLLATVMVISLLPLAALAADPMYFEVTVGDATTQYATAGEAYAAVEAALPSGGKATIKLLDDYTGPGLKITADKNLDLTFELNTHTWTVTNPLVGSTGTETNAFQLNKGNKVTFQNGAVTSSVARIFFQNYCDLVVDNVDVSITTTVAGSYAMSNNNASTLIKGGSTVTATAPGNFALDSFTFGGYTGGNVTIEDAEIIGNVEIANGGKVKLDGGVIDGDVIVYNYTYQQDPNVNKVASFTMEKGTVTGDVATSEIGSTTILGGEVKGEVTLDTTKTATAEIAGGVFGKVDGNVNITAADVATISTDAESKTVVGLSNINTLLETAGKGVTLTVTKAAEGSKIVAPVGVTVNNQSGNTILVNDAELGKGASLVVEAKEPEKDDDTTVPPTGDMGTAPLWNGLALLAVCTMLGTAVVVRKKVR